MRYYKKLVGEKLYLSPINIDDASQYCEWLNNLEITKYLLLSPQIINEEDEKEILRRLQSGKNFGIVDLKSDKLIGNCGFLDISSINRRAEVGIFIGDQSFHGKGYGREAINLLLDFGFNILNLHSISLKVYSYNRRAIKSYKGSGFKEVGRRRESIFFGGKYHDEIIMDILSNEFESVYIKKMCE